jgi:hypothetical protein
MKLTRTRIAATLALTLLSLSAAAGAEGAEDARKARVLVLLGAMERNNHIYIAGATEAPEEGGRSLANPLSGRSRVNLLYKQIPRLNQTFVRTISGFDRDPDLTTALIQVFRDRAPILEITTTADTDRYLRRATLASLTDAARNEGFDFVVALFDDFVGLATRDWIDAEAGLLAPAYRVSYALHDVAANELLKRGTARATGAVRAPLDAAAANRDLFVATWPYLCLLNATQIADELLRTDQLHFIAERVGRGSEMPPVAAKLADFERRLDWKLKPAKGWRDKSITGFSRLLEPRGDLSRVARLHYEVDLLIPELQQGAPSIDDYVLLYDRNRRLQMPLAGPLARFTDVSAPGYEAYRFTGQGSDHNLVFLKATPDAVVRIATFSLVGNFEERYPALRPKIEQMLAESSVTLKKSVPPKN